MAKTVLTVAKYAKSGLKGILNVIFSTNLKLINRYVNDPVTLRNSSI